MSLDLSRRALVAGAAGIAATPARAASADLRLKGLTTYSESAMIMMANPQRRSAFTLRICRFPELDATWLWGHLLSEGRFLAFTQHDLPSATDRINGRPGLATYGVPTLEGVRIARDLAAQGIAAASFEAALPFHASTHAPHGPGRVSARVTGAFRPLADLSRFVRSGRTEVMGEVNATLELAGRRFDLSGPGKFHEQHQTHARFIDPFQYSWLWSGTEGGVVVNYRDGPKGAWNLRGEDHAATGFKLDRPGRNRRLELALQNRPAAETVRLDTWVRYQIPIFDTLWSGTYVRATSSGRRFAGVVNEWRPEQLPGR